MLYGLKTKRKQFYPAFKRLLDVLLSIIGLILFSPLFAVIAFTIYLTSRGPIFYMQERVGKNWQLFRIIKFRTMILDAEKVGPEISTHDDPRITNVGKVLRKFKLDEIPQLINVLKGDMSLIGPRPEVLKYASFYSNDYSAILKIKPGISDYASIRFKDEASLIPAVCDCESFYIREIMPQKINLYKQYLKEVSFSTDMKILFTTLKALL